MEAPAGIDCGLPLDATCVAWHIRRSPFSPTHLSESGTAVAMPPPIPSAPIGTLMFKTSGPALIIETFQDFCCPFSKKMFVTLSEVMAALKEQGKSVDLLFQCVPQPWHAQSSYMHEVALAVKMLDESKFFDAAAAVSWTPASCTMSDCPDLPNEIVPACPPACSSSAPKNSFLTRQLLIRHATSFTPSWLLL